MVTILDEIISKLKEHDFTIPVKDVREQYSTKDPVYPMITVDEIVNQPTLQITGVEKYSRIDYRFDIYARDASKDGELYTKRQVASMIGSELDEIMRTTYGMKRVGNPIMLPYSEDGSIIRYPLTYTGNIDNKTMIIYQ